jgi:hypothetical protein
MKCSLSFHTWRLFSDCRTVDVACRHVWKLRLHFIFYYLMRHESYDRCRCVCVASLRASPWPHASSRSCARVLSQTRTRQLPLNPRRSTSRTKECRHRIFQIFVACSCASKRPLQPTFGYCGIGAFFSSSCGWVRQVDLVLRPLTDYRTRMIDDECGAVDGMRTGRGDRSSRGKPAPILLCPPQIPHDLTWARTLAGAVGSRRLTAWAMARPGVGDYFNKSFVSLIYTTTIWPGYSNSPISCLYLRSLSSGKATVKTIFQSFFIMIQQFLALFLRTCSFTAALGDESVIFTGGSGPFCLSHLVRPFSCQAVSLYCTKTNQRTNPLVGSRATLTQHIDYTVNERNYENIGNVRQSWYLRSKYIVSVNEIN